LRKETLDSGFALLQAPLLIPPIREIGKDVFDMKANYLGVFAIKGRIRDSSILPAKFDLFKLQTVACKQ